MHGDNELVGERYYYVTLGKKADELVEIRNPRTKKMETIIEIPTDYPKPSEIPQNMRTAHNTVFIVENYFQDEINDMHKYYTFYSPNGSVSFYENDNLNAGIMNNELKIIYPSTENILKLFKTDIEFKNHLLSLANNFRESVSKMKLHKAKTEEYYLVAETTEYYDKLTMKKSVTNTRRNLQKGIFIKVVREPHVSEDGAHIYTDIIASFYICKTMHDCKFVETIKVKNMDELRDYIESVDENFFKFLLGREMRELNRATMIEGNLVEYDAKGKEARDRINEAKYGRLFYVFLDKIKDLIPLVDKRHIKPLVYSTIAKHKEEIKRVTRGGGETPTGKSALFNSKDETKIIPMDLRALKNEYYLKADSQLMPTLTLMNFRNINEKLNMNRSVHLNISKTKSGNITVELIKFKNKGDTEPLAKLKMKNMDGLRAFIEKYFKNLYRYIANDDSKITKGRQNNENITVLIETDPNINKPIIAAININGTTTTFDIDNPQLPQNYTVEYDNVNRNLPLYLPLSTLISVRKGAGLFRKNAIKSSTIPKLNIRVPNTTGTKGFNINSELKNINSMIKGKNTKTKTAKAPKIGCGIKINNNFNIKSFKALGTQPKININNFTLGNMKTKTKMNNLSGNSILKNCIKIGGLKKRK